MPNPPISTHQSKLRYSLACSLYICTAIFIVWVWTNNQLLNTYSLQLTSLIVLVYFIAKTFINKKPAGHSTQLALDATTMTAVILLIVNSTGGLNSSLFFLIYFLLFAVALIFDTVTTLLLTIGIALFFGGSLTSSRAAIQLSSLLFFSPMAIYFGKQYADLLSVKHQVKELNEEYHTMSNDITMEESLTLTWLTLDFKDTLIKVISLTSEILSDIGTLKPRHKAKLTEILEESKELLVTGEKLKEEIDRETD